VFVCLFVCLFLCFFLCSAAEASANYLSGDRKKSALSLDMGLADQDLWALQYHSHRTPLQLKPRKTLANQRFPTQASHISTRRKLGKAGFCSPPGPNAPRDEISRAGESLTPIISEHHYGASPWIRSERRGMGEHIFVRLFPHYMAILLHKRRGNDNANATNSTINIQHLKCN
jgi:hypothetical protein